MGLAGGSRRAGQIAGAGESQFVQQSGAKLAGERAARKGTPAAANSVASANIAPLDLDVAHAPVIPRSTDPVTVTAEIRDESTTGVVATLFWRVDQANNTTPYTQTPMSDDGLHGDGAAGDGLYGADRFRPRPTARSIEFYVRAVDAGSRAGTWPGSDRRRRHARGQCALSGR